MKRRILINMLTAALLGVLIVSVVLTAVFYRFYASRGFDELRAYGDVRPDGIEELLNKRDIRVTVIGSDGQVLYDNTETAEALENHMDRPEIKDAVSYGKGESRRTSDTVGKDSYYYAVRGDDGIIIRYSRTADSMWFLFIKILPYIFASVTAIFIICAVYSVKATKNIVEPINNMNPEEGSIPYEELYPMGTKIAYQKAELNRQMLILRERADTINAIISNMREGLVLIDKEGTILLHNESAVLYLHDTYRDYTRENYVSFTRDVGIIEGIRKAHKGDASERVVENYRRSVELFFSPVKSEESVGAVIILLVDITEKQKSEKMRREFSANVSHELKTPLTTILGYSEMIDNKMVMPEDIPAIGGKIKTEVQRLILLIQDIIKLSALDEDGQEKAFEMFNLTELIISAAESLGMKCEEKSVEIEVSPIGLGINNELYIYADKALIYELIYNLAENGVKYNKEGGRVRITAEQTADTVEITVEDTGIGIPENQLSRVFERFYRVDKSRSKKTGGTGLGLSIAKHIAMYHNGDIGIQSEVGKGTKVTVTLGLS